jgi:hypothetical protein
MEQKMLPDEKENFGCRRDGHCCWRGFGAICGEVLQVIACQRFIRLSDIRPELSFSHVRIAGNRQENVNEDTQPTGLI